MSATVQTDVLPPFSRAALMLDLDGTLLDIAPTPDSVVVPDTLKADLRRLCHRLDGAVAVVSGRPVEQVDALLDGIPTAVAGEHGAALRPAPGAPVQRGALPHVPPDWLTEADRLAAATSGVMVERKAHGFVLHYRAVPEAGPALAAALRDLLATATGFTLLPARKAWEVRPAGTDKGSAVAALLRLPHFAGRLPVFIGDDVTDEDGMAAARAAGGAGLRVPEVFGAPAGVRAWLGRLAASREDAWAAW